MVTGREDHEGDPDGDGHAPGQEHRPLVVELRTAMHGDDELHRAADSGPDAEDRDDRL